MGGENFIDVKVTIWQRLHFKENADMDRVVEILKATGDTDFIADDDLGFRYMQTLDETEDRMTVEENDGNPTVEVYRDGNDLWNNAQKDQ
jgi:hypothetical protein